jgi:NADPH:quinone reductase-like Zn-dependent oxidoreductase
MMKRIQYHRYGGPEVLRLEDVEPPRPGPGEVLVRVHAAAANPMDWTFRNGEAKVVTGRKLPRGLGHDFSGVIAAVGDGVTQLAGGDDVFGATMQAGAFAEMVLADAAWVARKPANVSFEQAAALPIVAGTAFNALIRTGKLQEGQAVFITGCLGGVGRAATQLALQRGATVGGSCRATASQEARDLGIDPVVDFDFDPNPLRGRFDIVLDTSGVLPLDSARMLLTPGGRIIDLKPTPAKILRSLLPGPYTLAPMADGTVIGELARAAAEGILQQPIAQTVPLADAIPALTEFEQRRGSRGGKLIITVP